MRKDTRIFIATMVVVVVPAVFLRAVYALDAAARTTILARTVDDDLIAQRRIAMDARRAQARAVQHERLARYADDALVAAQKEAAAREAARRAAQEAARRAAAARAAQQAAAAKAAAAKKKKKKKKSRAS